MKGIGFWRIFVVLAGGFTQACQTQQQESAPKVVRPGQAIYAMHCATCHQYDGKGLLGGRRFAADFSDPNGVLNLKDEVLLQSVMNGKLGVTGRMPAFRPILSEEEVLGTIHFIRENFQNKSAQAPAGATP